MFTLRATLVTFLVALGTVIVTDGPVAAQTTGAGFCDVFGTLLGEEAQSECEAQGGDQIPLEEVTTPTCEAADAILTQFEEGGGEAIAEPVRQVFTESGVCVFGQEETTTTTAQPPPTTAAAPPTTSSPARGTLAATGGPLALTALGGLGLAGLALALRRVRRLS